MNSLLRISCVVLGGLALFSWITTAGWPTFWTTPIYHFELWLIFHHLNYAFLTSVVVFGCLNVFTVGYGVRAMWRDGHLRLRRAR